MNCRKIQELLMTDYIDGEEDAKMRSSILQHLYACDKCRKLEESLKQKAVDPFLEAEKRYPPDYIWKNIQNQIVEEASAPEKIKADIGGRLSDIFKTLKPAFIVPAVAVAVLAIILIVGASLIDEGRLDTYMTEQAEFIINLDANGIDAGGLGTSIEEYFLS